MDTGETKKVFVASHNRELFVAGIKDLIAQLKVWFPPKSEKHVSFEIKSMRDNSVPGNTPVTKGYDWEIEVEENP